MQSILELIAMAVFPDWTEVAERLEERNFYDRAREIADSHHVTMSELCGRRKHRHIIFARHDVWLFLRDEIGLSYPAIAHLWGVDHTTVINGVRRATKRRPEPSKVRIQP